VEDKAHASDNIVTKLKVKAEDIKSFRNDFNKLVLISFVFIVTMELLCLIPFYEYYENIVWERISLISIGMLTFISIFYSLLMSEEGKNIISAIDNRLVNEENELRKTTLEKIKKSNDIEQIDKEIRALNKELQTTRARKKWIDLEYTLISAVMMLIMATVLSIYNIEYFKFISYSLLTLGITFTIVLVIQWRLLGIIARKHKLV